MFDKSFIPSPAVKPTIEYYSGSQVTVFIDDIWIDDTASYEIAIQQTKQPIYGYGSQHYDFVAKGKVAVNGSLTINFKDPNYLWIILAHREAKRTKEAQENIINLAKNAMIKDNSTGELKNPEQILAQLRDPDPSSENFQRITSILKNDYWQNAIPELRLIDEERTNHRPFRLTFLYKGDAIGVIESIEDVELLGKSKIVQIDGQPVAETYNFIARKYT